MRSQDDITFQSQEFANQVEGRRDQIAQTQIGLNMQAGQLSAQAIQAYQQGQQFRMEQAQDATNLAADQFKLQQAAEELQWARQLRSDKMLRNMLARDDAQTQLAIAQAQSERTKLKGFDPSRFSDPMHRLGALAAGLDVKYDSTSGQVAISDTPLPKEARDNAMQQYMQMYTERYGPRTRAGGDETMVMKRNADLAQAALDAGDEEAYKFFLSRAGIKVADEQKPTPKQEVKANIQSATIPGLGEKNSQRVTEFLNRPQEIKDMREILMAGADPERRKVYNPSDQEVVDTMLQILRDRNNPFHAVVMNVLAQEGLLDREELSKNWTPNSTMSAPISPTIPQGKGTVR